MCNCTELVQLLWQFIDESESGNLPSAYLRDEARRKLAEHAQLHRESPS